MVAPNYLALRRQRANNFQRWYNLAQRASNAWSAGSSAGRRARGIYDQYFTPSPTPPFRMPSNQEAMGMEMDPSGVASQTTGIQTYGGNASKPYVTQYKKKYQSKKNQVEAKKYYNSFLKTYRKVSGVALQKLVINSSVSATAIPAAQQWVAAHIGSYVSTATDSRETGQRDLRVMLDAMTNTKFTDDVDGSSRRIVENAIGDLTLTNTGIGRIEVDKYVIEYNDDAELVTLASLFTNGSNNQISLTSTGTDRLTINDRGVTLFDLSYVLSVGKIKIVSKDKIFMGPSDSINVQEKINKKQTLTPDVLLGETSFMKSGYTRTVLFVFKSVTGDTNTASVSLGATRSYGFRVDGQSIQANAKLSA